MMVIVGNVCVQIYSLYHPDFTSQPWHIFVAYIICTWLGCAVVIFANRLLPMLNTFGFFFIIAGVFITILVCAAMPGTDGRPTHSSNAFVWSEWSSDIGYTSQGFVFLLGMVNGAFSVGTPDCISHLSEEIPRPEVNVPRAIAAQMLVGFITGFTYLVAVLYSINDLDMVYSVGGTFPIAQIYLQATSSAAGATGLLVLILIPTIIASIGDQLTASRTLWTMARDRATPFPKALSYVSNKWGNPIFAQLLTTILITVFGCIYIGSTTAFNAIVGSFVILSTASYLAALLPNLLTRRKYIQPGPFYMRGILGNAFLSIASIYIIVFIVIFCFPYSLPVTAQNMNYSCLIFGGITVFMGFWWFADARKNYAGPAVMEQWRQHGGSQDGIENENRSQEFKEGSKEKDLTA